MTHHIAPRHTAVRQFHLEAFHIEDLAAPCGLGVQHLLMQVCVAFIVVAEYESHFLGFLNLYTRFLNDLVAFIHGILLASRQHVPYTHRVVTLHPK